MIKIKKIKVLVIDDSALVREVLTNLLKEDQQIEVVGTAKNPIAAIEKIKQEKPDVLTLDLQMPRMDGLTFLRRLMSSYPLPVIVISSLTRQGSKETIKALELGALDFVAKPKVGINRGLKELGAEIIKKIKNAAGVSVKKINKQLRESKSDSSQEKVAKPSKQKVDSTIELIAIGASTGGTVAVRNILTKLPDGLPGIVIVLHMPANFTKSYAENLNDKCDFKVKEAEDGEKIESGHAYIAQGGKHLLVEKGVTDYFLKLNNDPPLGHHRPAVDKTFASITDIIAPNCIGVILTGMGSDGAKSLKAMNKRGSFTIAQDEETSVVFGMPKQAINLGAVDSVLPINKIPKSIIKALE